MPHCEKEILESLEQGRKPMVAGELTAMLYKECVEFMVRKGRNFSAYCVVMGALVCCMFEFYRKKVSVYEDEKIANNGEYKGNIG